MLTGLKENQEHFLDETVVWNSVVSRKLYYHLGVQPTSPLNSFYRFILYLCYYLHCAHILVNLNCLFCSKLFLYCHSSETTLSFSICFQKLCQLNTTVSGRHCSLSNLVTSKITLVGNQYLQEGTVTYGEEDEFLFYYWKNTVATI